MTNITEITTDELLAAFFHTKADGAKGVRRERVLRVERRLRECLEAEGYRVLVTGDLARLEAERVFDPENAFTCMADASDLVLALPIFLDPDWLMTERLDRGAQLTLVDQLTAFALAHGLVDRYDYACALLDIRCAIDRARDELRAARRAPNG